MEQLPFIDDITLPIAAPPENVWRALLRTLGPRRSPRLPAWLARAWGLRHTERTGDWRDEVHVGDTIPGFSVAECIAPERLTLRGRHRFSRYELRFELEEAREGVIVHAKTSAIFPGLAGWLYRACVIGSGGHRIVGRRMLASLARRALAA